MDNNEKFITLYEAIDKEIKYDVERSKFKRLDDFITDEKDSSIFIENMINTKFN